MIDALVRRAADDLLGQPDLPGDLDRERAARLARFEPEQRPDVLHVERHRAVEDAFGVAGVIFQVRVVGRDDSEADRKSTRLNSSHPK